MTTPAWIATAPKSTTMGSFDSTSANCLRIQKLLSTILFTTHSTALMYYGDEIAMSTTPPARIEDVKDPIGKLGWPVEKGRDGDRTPMQWTPAHNAGFTTASATPWLPIPPSASTFNVETEKSKPDSMLNWYTRLTTMRRTNPALVSGLTTMLDPTNTNVLSYTRKDASGKTVLVALNMTSTPQTMPLDATYKTLLADNMADTQAKTLQLPPYGTWVGERR